MDGNITSGGTERSLYLTQIRYLEEQLDRCQPRYDELEKENNQLTSRYSALEKEKQDKEYLKCYMNTKEKKVDHLDELEIQHQAAQKEREVLELQHSQDLQRLREQVEELNTRILMGDEELEEQEEQLLQLKQCFSEMESLKEKLKHQKEEHKAVINNLKKDGESEKIRTLEKLQDYAERRVEKETERILKTVRVHLRDWPQELVSLHKVSDVLQRERVKLQDRESAARTNRDELEEHTKEMAGKIRHQLKDVQKLRYTYLDQKEELKVCNVNMEHLLTNWDNLRHEVLALHEQSRQKTAELEQLEAELQRQRNRVRLLEGVKLEAAVILKHIMTIKTQRQSLQDQEKRSDIQGKTERLLEILESTAPQGSDSTLRLQKTSSCGNLFAPPQANQGPDPDPEAATSAD